MTVWGCFAIAIRHPCTALDNPGSVATTSNHHSYHPKTLYRKRDNLSKPSYTGFYGIFRKSIFSAAIRVFTKIWWWLLRLKHRYNSSPNKDQAKENNRFASYGNWVGRYQSNSVLVNGRQRPSQQPKRISDTPAHQELSRHILRKAPVFHDSWFDHRGCIRESAIASRSSA